MKEEEEILKKEEEKIYSEFYSDEMTLFKCNNASLNVTLYALCNFAVLYAKTRK